MCGSLCRLHCRIATAGSDSKNCWFLTFVYFRNVTQLKLLGFGGKSEQHETGPLQRISMQCACLLGRLPPQTGPDGWLHCTIGYAAGTNGAERGAFVQTERNSAQSISLSLPSVSKVDGKTELAAAWDGEEPRITIESYTKD